LTDQPDDRYIKYLILSNHTQYWISRILILLSQLKTIFIKKLFTKNKHLKYHKLKIFFTFVPSMKWLVIIWTFYLVAISMLPCSDYSNRCEDRPLTTQTSNQEHDHNRDSDDSCTPFCHCSCCSISIAFTDVSIVPHLEKTSPSFFAKKLFWNNDFFVSAYSGNIWQPPRINA